MRVRAEAEGVQSERALDAADGAAVCISEFTDPGCPWAWSAELANWSGGRRYTCPSYELVRRSDEVRIAVPGFQPFATYDVITANLVPGLDRRPEPTSVEEVLRWAGEPLATQEVAVVCGIPFEQARQDLGRVAVEHHVGADGLWSLPSAA